MSGPLKDRLDAIEASRQQFTAELSARLNEQLDRLAAERGITREEIVEIAREYLSRPTHTDQSNGRGE